MLAEASLRAGLIFGSKISGINSQQYLKARRTSIVVAPLVPNRLCASESLSQEMTQSVYSPGFDIWEQPPLSCEDKAEEGPGSLLSYRRGRTRLFGLLSVLYTSA
jgi:hypothetical protein